MNWNPQLHYPNANGAQLPNLFTSPPVYPHSNTTFVRPTSFETSPSPFDVDQFLTDIQNRSAREINSERAVFSSPISVPASPLPSFIDRENERRDNRTRYDFNQDVLDTVIDTIYLRLYPTDIWESARLTAKQIVDQYFKRRSSKKMPFHYKLYNALQITTQHPELVPVFGAQWVTDTVFKIYRLPFANLLGVGSINGALFNKQGSLPTHGFLTVFPQTVYGINPRMISDVDNDSVRMFRHASPYFHINATESELAKCRWKNPRN